MFYPSQAHFSGWATRLKVYITEENGSVHPFMFCIWYRPGWLSHGLELENRCTFPFADLKCLYWEICDKHVNVYNIQPHLYLLLAIYGCFTPCITLTDTTIGLHIIASRQTWWYAVFCLLVTVINIEIMFSGAINVLLSHQRKCKKTRWLYLLAYQYSNMVSLFFI
jgi:hypothetical protein